MERSLLLEKGDQVFGRYSIAVVTPFLAPNEEGYQGIDFDAMRTILAHLAEQLARLRNEFRLIGGIILSGTTGEQHSMTVEEKMELYKFSVEIVKEFGVPVIAGISTTTLAQLRRLITSAIASGVEGIMLGMPPYIRASDSELSEYVHTAKRMVPSSFPILLYNNIVRNGYGPSLPVLASWFREGYICGVKYAVAPHEEFLRQTEALLQLEPSLRLYTGSDALSSDLLPSRVRRSPTENNSTPLFYGLTSIVGNLFPYQVGRGVALMTGCATDGLDSGDSQDEKAVTGKKIMIHTTSLANATLLGVSVPVGIKYASGKLGRPAGQCRAPLGHISNEKCTEIDNALKDFQNENII